MLYVHNYRLVVRGPRGGGAHPLTFRAARGVPSAAPLQLLHAWGTDEPPLAPVPSSQRGRGPCRPHQRPPAPRVLGAHRAWEEGPHLGCWPGSWLCNPQAPLLLSHWWQDPIWTGNPRVTKVSVDNELEAAPPLGPQAPPGPHSPYAFCRSAGRARGSVYGPAACS